MPTDFYEREEGQRWCTQCERWEDSCICEELSEFHQERVKTEEDRYWEEATCDYLDHNFPAPVLADPATSLSGCSPAGSKTMLEVAGEARESTAVNRKLLVPDSRGGESFPSAEEQLAFWESDAFLVGHNGEQPHE